MVTKKYCCVINNCSHDLLSHHVTRLEWCSCGPTSTTGDSSWVAWMSLWTAPVQPDPVKITASSSLALQLFRTMSRASCLRPCNCKTPNPALAAGSPVEGGLQRGDGGGGVGVAVQRQHFA